LFNIVSVNTYVITLIYGQKYRISKIALSLILYILLTSIYGVIQYMVRELEVAFLTSIELSIIEGNGVYIPCIEILMYEMLYILLCCDIEKATTQPQQSEMPTLCFEDHLASCLQILDALLVKIVPHCLFYGISSQDLFPSIYGRKKHIYVASISLQWFLTMVKLPSCNKCECSTHVIFSSHDSQIIIEFLRYYWSDEITENHMNLTKC
ncbi:hypothetical protein ACJX0J_007657, partial [Zea mays]